MVVIGKKGQGIPFLGVPTFRGTLHLRKWTVSVQGLEGKAILVHPVPNGSLMVASTVPTMMGRWADHVAMGNHHTIPLIQKCRNNIIWKK